MVNDITHTILAVDDARDTLMLLDLHLSEHGYNVITANSGEKAFTELASNKIDLVLLDLYMPNLSGLATLEKIRADEQFDHIPVIMLSASNDEDEIVSALELGAEDYVTKPYIVKVLLARIRNAIRLKEKNIELEVLAKTDHLTGLSNRKTFYEYTQKAVIQSNRTQNYPIVIAMFDIDYFKKVNDKYGHDAGDIVLRHFAKLINASFREYDVVARIGGEEFAVCMPNTTIKEAVLACERFREQVSYFQFTIAQDRSEVINITTSVGVASNQGQVFSLTTLMKIADQALYQAKAQGRNQVIDNSTFIDEDSPSEKADEKEFPGIDLTIGLKNVLDDKNLFNEILIMFYQDHHEDVKKLRQALSHNDILTAKHLAHTLKGVASSIGAMKLFEKAKILDDMINANYELDVLMKNFDIVSIELNIVLSGVLEQLSDRL